MEKDHNKHKSVYHVLEYFDMSYTNETKVGYNALM